MTAYRHFSPTTVHVLRDGKRIGSLYRGATGSWFFEARVTLPNEPIIAAMKACTTLHGKFASPELVQKLNP